MYLNIASQKLLYTLWIIYPFVLWPQCRIWNFGLRVTTPGSGLRKNGRCSPHGSTLAVAAARVVKVARRIAVVMPLMKKRTRWPSLVLLVLSVAEKTQAVLVTRSHVKKARTHAESKRRSRCIWIRTQVVAAQSPNPAVSETRVRRTLAQHWLRQEQTPTIWTP